MNHPNIITIYEVYQQDLKTYVVQDLCKGGELFEKIVEAKTFTENTAAYIMKQVLSGVYYCHTQKVVHRDLKPENILFTKNDILSPIKIVDFGTAVPFYEKHKMSQCVGSSIYMAPEVIKKSYTEKCDSWSCGVITYVLLCGYAPFEGDNTKETFALIKKGKYELSGNIWDDVSEAAKNFIRKMLEMNPAKRYSADQALADPWIRKAKAFHTESKQIPAKVISNLKTYRATKKLQRAIWEYIVSYIATSEEKNKLIAVFKQLDANNDGFISKEELLANTRSLEDIAISDGDQEALFDSLDANQDGKVQWSEFLQGSLSRFALL